jgi:hypothetical protein
MHNWTRLIADWAGCGAAVRTAVIVLVAVLGLGLAVVFVSSGPGADAATPAATAPAATVNPPPDRPGGYKFDKIITRQVLENYLARSISYEGILNGRGDVNDAVRMFKGLGVKYAGRSICLFGGEANLLKNFARAKEQLPLFHKADPDMVMEACVFEIVSTAVEQIPVPDWVFTAFGKPVEKRNFKYNDIIYPPGPGRRAWGPNASTPDVSQPECQLWFYYLAASYIDLGFEGIHFGQVEIMNNRDRANVNWDKVLTMVREYATKNARRHMVLCNGHTPTGGLVGPGGKLLLDFHAFPLRVKEVPDKPQEGILQMGYSDTIFGRSKGGTCYSGWKCDHLPYLAELDNYGGGSRPGQPGQGGFLVWGYDEITWFAHQTREYRAKWLQYAWDWLRKNDPNGWLQMPGGRTASSSDIRWYFGNNPSPACPTGLGDEDGIRAVWAGDSAKMLAGQK